MPRTTLITAIGTPLRDDDTLHADGLAQHLDDQWSAGIDGLLVGGTMGFMQMLPDATYRALIEQTVALSRGRGPLLVGIGDNSLGRTLDRLRFCERFEVQGAVVLGPSFLKFNEPELLRYFTAVADASSLPVYLYDLPPLLGYGLSLDLVLKLAEHPNIAGIKCSGAPDLSRQLIDEVPAGAGFRVVVAQPMHLDTFIRAGVRQHLDGIYALIPRHVRALADAADSGDFATAHTLQAELSRFLRTLRGNVAGVFTAVMNARGIAGRFGPRPMTMLSAEEAARVTATPNVRALLEREAAVGGAVVTK